MKSTYRHIAIISLSTLLFTSAGAALAYGGPKGDGGCERGGKQETRVAQACDDSKGRGGCERGGKHGPMAALTRLDDLTDEQKTLLKDIRRATRNTMRDLRDGMEDNREDLHDAVADNADIETIRKLARQQGDLVAQKIVLRAETRNKINSVLTEEQQQQLEDMRRPRKEFGQGPKGF